MYQKLLKWAKDSEIILIARLQAIGGVLLLVLDVALPVFSNTDMTVFLSNPKQIALAGIVNGVLTELLRRYRATDLGV